LSVCFTGPAHNAAGMAILRADLIVAAQNCGYQVQSQMSATTQLLVASRDDTVKAAKAAERGIEVITYPEFLGRMAMLTLTSSIPATESKHEPDVWVDPAPEDMGKVRPYDVNKL